MRIKIFWLICSAFAALGTAQDLPDLESNEIKAPEPVIYEKVDFSYGLTCQTCELVAAEM